MHDDRAPIEFGHGESILCRKQLLLRLENFKIVGFARNVALQGDLDGLPVGFHSADLLGANRLIFLARDKGVGYVLEGAQCRLFVLQFRLFPECDGLALSGP